MPEMRGGIQNKKARANAVCTLPAPDGLRRTHALGSAEPEGQLELFIAK